MPVRVDGADASVQAPPPQPRRHRRLLLTVLVVVVVGVGLGLLIVRAITPAAPGAQPAPDPAEQGSQGSRGPRIGEPLPRSGIVAGGGGIDHIYELRTGFSKTTDGAVQAAMNFVITDAGPAYYNQAHYEAIQAYMFASPQARRAMGYSQDSVDAMRKQYQVNAEGQPLTDGTPDPRKRIWDAMYLQYGAYRVVEESPDRVRVMMWAPYVYGVDRIDAASAANLHIGWAYADVTVSWVDGDWRQSGNKAYPAEQVPKPADPDQVVTSFAERADLLGTDLGWTLPANAAETDIPELQLPGK
jgi:hypothetical protein